MPKFMKEKGFEHDAQEFNARGEYNCVVRAFASAWGVDYMDAWTLMQDYLSRDKLKDIHRHGISTYDVKEVIKEYDCGWEVWNRFNDLDCLELERHKITGKWPRRLTVMRAIREHCQTGTYLIRIHRHIFCVIDGVIQNDYMDEARRHAVTNIWKIKS